MDKFLQKGFWHQFGAAIDMLDNALLACPEEFWEASLWNDPEMGPKFSKFWYVAYHTLFWLDLYLTGFVENFMPPSPFSLDELDPSGLLPERVYSHLELRNFLSFCRNKCFKIIISLSEERSKELCKFPWGELSFFELLLDNMRHIQEHGAQLNMFLGQQNGISNRWVARPVLELK
ncbi:MAG: DinB family protein [Chloroflexota bacterium]